MCFSGCSSLFDIEFEAGSKLERIGAGAFSGTALTRIRIPSNVLVIGSNCFAHRVLVSADSDESYSYKCLYDDRSICFDEHGRSLAFITRDEDDQDRHYSDSDRNRKLCYEFQYDSSQLLCEVILEPGSRLARLGANAFCETAIRRLVVPSNVEEIGYSCFALCESLSEISFEPGSRVKTLKAKAFYGTAIGRLTVPSSVEEIGEECFASCESLSEVIFEPGSNLQRIGHKAFDDALLEIIQIPSSAKLSQRK
jgi:hypothetical protein